MVLKMAAAQLKGGRGLAYDNQAYFTRADVFLVTGIVIQLGQMVKAGEETPVIVSLAGLRPNANVKRIKAALRVYEGTSAEPAANTLHVQEGQGPARTFVVSAEGPPGLSNVSLRLDPGTVFWTHAGRLEPGSHAIPVDFADQVNHYLDHTAHGEGALQLRFMLKSDTPGRVDIIIGVDDYDYTLLQTQTWPNELDGTLRVDRNLSLDFNSVERLPLTAIAPVNGKAPALEQIRLDVSGQFGPERLLESIEMPSQGEFGTVNSEYSLARGFILDPAAVKGGAVQCAGFSAYLRVGGEAEIYAELQVDAAPAANGEVGAVAGAAGPGTALNGTASAKTAPNGTTLRSAAMREPMSARSANGNGPAAAPSGLSLPAAGAPLAKANLVIAPPPEAQGQPSERWVFVRFEAPVELQVGLPYWVVIKGIRGEAYIGLRAGTGAAPGEAVQAVREDRLRINRGGQLWKPLQRGAGGSLRARLALVYIPGPDNGVTAVKISVEGAGAAALIDPAAEAETTALNLGGASLPAGAVLVVRSNASGALTLTNVIQEYRPA